VSRTRSCGRHRRPQSRRLEGDPAALRADDLAAADPGIRIGATPAVFCGRAAHVTGARESRTGRHRQLTVCRAAVAACGGQETAVYLGEGCRADHPRSRRALLSAPGRPRGSGVDTGRRRRVAPAPAPRAPRTAPVSCRSSRSATSCSCRPVPATQRRPRRSTFCQAGSCPASRAARRRRATATSSAAFCGTACRPAAWRR
jgi:hypothetical protein